jgi:hypothetical protein
MADNRKVIRIEPGVIGGLADRNCAVRSSPRGLRQWDNMIPYAPYATVTLVVEGCFTQVARQCVLSRA